MTLLSVYLGVGWGSREGGGVHALQPNSSMGMGQQLWRHPQGQREKSYCYSPCSQSSALVTSFWMNALGSLITLLFVVGMIFLKLGSYPVTKSSKICHGFCWLEQQRTIWPTFVFINKVLLEQLHSPFTYYLCCFYATISVLRGCDRELMAHNT